LRLHRLKGDIAELARRGGGNQLLALGAGADQQETDRRMIAKALGGVEDAAQIMRHAVSPEIAHDEFAGEPPFRRELYIARLRRVARQIEAVADDVDFVGDDAAADEVCLEGRGERDDQAAPPIQEELEGFDEGDEPALLDRADGEDRARPEIAELE